MFCFVVVVVIFVVPVVLLFCFVVVIFVVPVLPVVIRLRTMTLACLEGIACMNNVGVVSVAVAVVVVAVAVAVVVAVVAVDVC